MNEKFEFVDKVKSATSGTLYLSIPHELKEFTPIGTLLKVNITILKKQEGGE